MIPSALSKAISTDLPSVIVVVGEASLIVERSEQAVVESVLPSIGMPALNHSVFRAAEVSSADLLATLETVPMMSERRLVVLRGIEEGKDELFQGLLEWLATPRPEVVLVVSGSRFPPVRKGGSNWAVRMRNALKSTGLFLKLGPRDVSPSAVVREHARSLGCEIDGRAVSLLVETVGEDLGRLVQELEKLALFAGDATTLTADMILQSSSRVAEADVWQLTAALVSRDVNAALAALHRALEDEALIDPVAPQTAIDEVVACTTGDPVASGASAQNVGAPSAADPVVAAQAANDVVLGSTREAVSPVRPQDGPRLGASDLAFVRFGLGRRWRAENSKEGKREERSEQFLFHKRFSHLKSGQPRRGTMDLRYREGTFGRAEAGRTAI